MKQFFRLDAILCSSFIFLFIGFLWIIPAQFEVLDPVGEALSDMELTDIVFSKLRNSQVSHTDTNIVLVNIGHLKRDEVGELLSNIDAGNPKVIGIDAFFRAKKTFDEDIGLIMGLGNVNSPVVMVNELLLPHPNSDCFDSIAYSNPLFTQNTTSGFSNFITGGNEGYRTVRQWMPFGCASDSTIPAFTSKVLEIYDPANYKAMVARGNLLETINWTGNYKAFFHLDYSDVLKKSFNPNFLKDKIVLLGYIGPQMGVPSFEDIFFTPLNEKTAGRSFPDMYGVTVHANILAQMLNNRYINTLPTWINGLIALVLVYLNVVLFLFIAERYKVYYDLITKVLILVELIALFTITIFGLHWLSIKVELTVAFLALVFSGDLTELYIGSLKHLGANAFRKVKGLFR